MNLESIKKGLSKTLGIHGHVYQYNVLEKFNNLHQKYDWQFEVSEFPVAINNSDTKIDFILTQKKSTIHNNILICECKKIDDSLSNWVFIKVPYVKRGEENDVVYFDRIKYHKKENFHPCIINSDIVSADSNKIYHLAYELKDKTLKFNKDKIDTANNDCYTCKVDLHPGKNAIENSTYQVLKGTNGLIEEYSNINETKDKILNFIPVIFTTAEIFVANFEITNANSNYEIESDNINIETAPWIWYQHETSKSIKHHVKFSRNLDLVNELTLSEIFKTKYLRHIAIVNINEIECFLKELRNLNINK